MRKIYTLLMLCIMGTVASWADTEITETYDFGAFITANGTGNLTVSGDGIAQTGTSAKVGTVKVIDNLVAGGQTLDLKGRFAVDYQYNAGVQIRFMWRSSSNAYQHGLAGQWNNNGTADAEGAARFSVLNLKAGDKITFTYAKQSGKAADPYTCAAGAITVGETSVGVDAALASGTEYTVVADGNLDLYFTNNNFAISKIVIKTTGNENVSAPTYAVTGVSGVGRVVTISAGVSDAGKSVTTYYTTDGTTPSTTSASFTGASTDITVGADATEVTDITIKAMSISTDGTSSEVSSSEVTVGNLIKLAAPEIAFVGMENIGGVYYKQYVFKANTTGTFNNPEITLTATFNGTAVTSPFSPTTAGTISVTASSTGYDTSDAATFDAEGTMYGLKNQFDFTKDEYRDGLATEGNNITINGTGVQVYRVYETDYVDGITLSNTNFGFTKAQNYDTCKGLAPRWGKGTITVNDWNNGDFATLKEYVGETIYATSNDGTFSFGSQINYNTFTELNIYNLIEQITIPDNVKGFGTYVTTNALDFSGVEGLEAYIAEGENSSKVYVTKVDEVPAGTPIIVKGTSGVTYSVPVGTCTTEFTTNMLHGSATETHTVTLGEVVYAFNKTSGNLNLVNTGVVIPAKKAYFLSMFDGNDSNQAKEIAFFGEEETAVSSVNADVQKADARLFNAAGQQVTGAYKGLVIDENGNKYIK